jgi:hypothetical protein
MVQDSEGQVFETIAIVSTLIFAGVFVGLFLMNRQAQNETADRKDPPRIDPSAPHRSGTT